MSMVRDTAKREEKRKSMDWKQWKACANEELPSGLWEIAFDYDRWEWAFKQAMIELELKAFKVLTPSFFCEQPL